MLAPSSVCFSTTATYPSSCSFMFLSVAGGHRKGGGAGGALPPLKISAKKIVFLVWSEKN